ncbi:MAG: hypothetical protein PVG71_08890 [Anaerolineae bacterium]
MERILKPTITPPVLDVALVLPTSLDGRSCSVVAGKLDAIIIEVSVLRASPMKTPAGAMPSPLNVCDC